MCNFYLQRRYILYKVVSSFFILIMYFFFASSAVTEEIQVNLKELSQLRWKNRVVVVFDEQENDQVLSMLNQQAEGLNDRDIIWFVVDNNNIQSNYNREIFSTFIASLQSLRLIGDEEKTQEVILIGKDGGVKNRSKELDFNDLYRLIDGMPMRQQELRGRRGLR